MSLPFSMAAMHRTVALGASLSEETWGIYGELTSIKVLWYDRSWGGVFKSGENFGGLFQGKIGEREIEDIEKGKKMLDGWMANKVPRALRGMSPWAHVSWWAMKKPLHLSYRRPVSGWCPDASESFFSTWKMHVISQRWGLDQRVEIQGHFPWAFGFRGEHRATNEQGFTSGRLAMLQ